MGLGILCLCNTHPMAKVPVLLDCVLNLLTCFIFRSRKRHKLHEAYSRFAICYNRVSFSSAKCSSVLLLLLLLLLLQVATCWL